jgi:hypothetical protein
MIKKQFKEVYEFLMKNQEKKVGDILPMLTQLMSSKNQERSYLADEDGNIIAIHCYYHKKWELVDYVEYGKKASTATGLNTMCKEGVRMWTKQQNEAKKAREILLAKVAAGTLNTEQLAEELRKIETERHRIEPLPSSFDRYSYETKEEALAAYTKLTNKTIKPA